MTQNLPWFSFFNSLELALTDAFSSDLETQTQFFSFNINREGINNDILNSTFALKMAFAKSAWKYSWYEDEGFVLLVIVN